MQAPSSAWDFAVAEVGNERPIAATFGWDRQDTRDVFGVLGMLKVSELGKRMDRSEPGVRGSSAVTSLMLQMIQERRDKWGVDVGDVEL